MQEVMTPDQVAGYLKLNTDTVYRLIRANRLAAVRIGRAYRVPREDLEAFLQANSSRPAVREALFSRVKAIGDRNTKLDGDQLLEELEILDESRRPSQQTK